MFKLYVHNEFDPAEFLHSPLTSKRFIRLEINIRFILNLIFPLISFIIDVFKFSIMMSIVIQECRRG